MVAAYNVQHGGLGGHGSLTKAFLGAMKDLPSGNLWTPEDGPIILTIDYQNPNFGRFLYEALYRIYR